MNALVVIHYPMFGGPHNRVLRLNGGLASRGWHTIALLPDAAGNAAARLRTGGVDVVQIPMRRLRASLDPQTQVGFWLHFAGDIGRIREVIRRCKVDLVVVGGLVNPHAAIAAKLEGVPVVWQIVDSRTPWPLRAVCMPLVNRWANAIMFCGKALVDLHFNGRPSKAPSFVCPPPVDLDRFSPSPERRRETRRRLGIPQDALVVGTVSNLTPAKGVEYFIRAATRIYRSQPNTWFLVVGARYETHRRYTHRLESEVSCSPIPRDHFLFVGEQADVENYYPAMDVKLITSVPRSEGTTSTSMEAMGCEIPVVATDVGAVSEVVEDGVTGFLVPARDDAALAARTIELLRHPQQRALFGANGRRGVERLSIGACSDRYLEVFDTAIGHQQLALPNVDRAS